MRRVSGTVAEREMNHCEGLKGADIGIRRMEGQMEHIGEKALTFRSPAVVNGELSYLKLEQYRGQWVAVSFVPCLGRIEAGLLDRYSTDVELLGATLLLVSANPIVLR